MLLWYQLAQLAFALLLGLRIAERVHALHLKLATSDEALRWLLRELKAGRQDHVEAWGKVRAESQAARLLLAHHSDLELRELLLDLRDQATAHLNVLRVGATIASTMGLLGGILALTGTLRVDLGLEALQAGAAQRAQMHQAIATMAIGVGSSALCFQALSLLRPAARKLVEQAEQVATALGKE